MLGPVATISMFTTLKSYLRNIEAYIFSGSPSSCEQRFRFTILKYFLWEGVTKKSQHGCGRWAPQPHLTPPCSDFACGGLRDIDQRGGTNECTNRGGRTNARTNPRTGGGGEQRHEQGRTNKRTNKIQRISQKIGTDGRTDGQRFI